MNRHGIIFLSLFIFLQKHPTAQGLISSKIPLVRLNTMEGKSANTSLFSNNGKPMVIDFWATWCIPCVMELNAIADKYDYWKRETGVKIIIIAVDTVHNTSTVSSFVRGKGWKYEVYLDPDKKFQNAMQVMDTPCTFVIDGSGQIVWVHNSYMEGDEDKIFDELKKITAKK